MKTHLKTIAIGFVGAVLGLGVWVLAATAYQDHKFVQTLVQIESQRQAAQHPAPTQ